MPCRRKLIHLIGEIMTEGKLYVANSTLRGLIARARRLVLCWNATRNHRFTAYKIQLETKSATTVNVATRPRNFFEFRQVLRGLPLADSIYPSPPLSSLLQIVLVAATPGLQFISPPDKRHALLNMPYENLSESNNSIMPQLLRRCIDLSHWLNN